MCVYVRENKEQVEIKGRRKENICLVAAKRRACVSLFTVTWFNQHYFLFLSNIRESSPGPSGHTGRSFHLSPVPALTWPLIFLGSWFQTLREIKLTTRRTQPWRHFEIHGFWCNVSGKKKKKRHKRPTDREINRQLTHCCVGNATDVSTSAMAPSIWSVRPWFFCRAFILTGVCALPNVLLALAGPISAPWLTACCATVWNRACLVPPRLAGSSSCE